MRPWRTETGLEDAFVGDLWWRYESQHVNSYFDCGWLKSRAKVCRICRVRPDERKKNNTHVRTLPVRCSSTYGHSTAKHSLELQSELAVRVQVDIFELWSWNVQPLQWCFSKHTSTSQHGCLTASPPLKDFAFNYLILSVVFWKYYFHISTLEIISFPNVLIRKKTSCRVKTGNWNSIGLRASVRWGACPLTLKPPVAAVCPFPVSGHRSSGDGVNFNKGACLKLKCGFVTCDITTVFSFS